MMVQAQEDMGEDSEIPTDSHHTPTVNQPSTSSPPQKKQKSKKSKKKITKVPQFSDSTNNVADEHVTTTSNDPLLSGSSRRIESSIEANLGDQKDTSKQESIIDNLCNSLKNVSQQKYVRGRYFIIQQNKIQENDL
nr:hypothetical protein [Tanacetum cinerariifolium]